ARVSALAEALRRAASSSDTFEGPGLTAAALANATAASAGLATAGTALADTTALPACARHPRRRLRTASGESPAALLTAEAALLRRATAECLPPLRVGGPGLVVALLRLAVPILHPLAGLRIVLPVASPATTVATACLGPVALVALGPIPRRVSVVH